MLSSLLLVLLSSEVAFTFGPEEVVFRWQKDRCKESDIADIFVRAFRDHEGKIVLVSGNAPDNYFLYGPDFDHLKRRCEPVLRSHDRPDAESFDNQEWVSATYTEDGKTVYALIHNEFHDPRAPNCKPGVSDPSNLCWYNSINFGVSTDGGRSFAHAPAPGHVLMPPFLRWNPEAMPKARGGGFDPPVYGSLAPSNIVKKDGFYYCLFFGLPDPSNPAVRGACLMRTADLADPKSWRLWDGDGFGGVPSNPYAPEHRPPKYAFVSPNEIGDLHGSLTFNTDLGKFLLVGTGQGHDPKTGEWKCGFFYSLSDDLIRWSPTRLLREAVFGFPPCSRPGKDLDLYPSLVDHDDTSRNFEFTGKRPYLYFVRWYQGEGRNSYDRDLVRVRLTLSSKSQ